MRCLRPVAVPLTLVLAFALFCAPARAVEFALSARSDAELVEHVGSLMGGLADVPVREDRSAVYLESAEVLRLKEPFRSTNNRLLYVLDPSDESLLTRTEHFSRGMEIVSADAFVIRNGGEVVHLDQRDVRTPPEDGNEWTPHVVIGFPPVELGDILGWCVVLERERPSVSSFRRLPRDHWVARSRFILDIEENVAFTGRVHNVTSSQVEIKTARRVHGHPTMIDVQVKNIPNSRGGVFSPPPLMIEPYVEIAMIGYYIERWGTWWTWDEWNALALGFDERREDRLEANGRIKDVVKETCRGLEDDLDKADALFRYVRDEIPRIENWEQRGGDLAARKVLEQGVATPFDKAVLLTSMLREIGLPASIGYARDRSLGPFDHDSAGFWQVTDAVVRVDTGDPSSPVWYVPGEEGCAARKLPPQLRQAEVVLFREDLQEQSEKLIRKAWVQYSHDNGGLARAYRRSVAEADWHEFIRTPGDPLEIAGRRSELRHLDLDSGDDRLEVTLVGLDPWAMRLRAGEDADEVSGDYRDHRSLPGELSSAVQYGRSPDGEEQKLTWTDATELPKRMGDTWVLPPELVFGTSLTAFWKGPDRGPIYLSYARVLESETEIQLPAGATAGGFTPSLQLNNPLFEYSSTIVVEGDILRIRRELKFRPGMLRDHAMGVLDDDIRRIFEFDAQPIVLKLGGEAG